MQRLICIFLFYLSVFPDQLRGQAFGSLQAGPDSVATLLGIKYHYGTILAHSAAIREVSNSNPRSFELAYSRLNSSDKAWQACNCYSRWGAAFHLVNFANPEVLGNAYNLVFFFEPILLQKGRLEITGKAGMGLGYVTKVFDTISNPQNLFFSTGLNFPLLLSLNFNYLLDTNWNLILSGYYNHSSNGGIKQPNLGINYPTLALGVSYIIDPIVLPKRVIPTRTEPYSLQKYLGLFGTTKSINDSTKVKQGRSLAIGLQAGVLKRLGKIYGASAGVEALYDESFRKEAPGTKEGYEKFIVALMLGNNLIFGKFHFSQQFGIYIDPPTPTTQSLFQRYALDYFIFPNLRTGISLKARGHVAENIDARIGIVF